MMTRKRHQFATYLAFMSLAILALVAYIPVWRSVASSNIWAVIKHAYIDFHSNQKWLMKLSTIVTDFSQLHVNFDEHATSDLLTTAGAISHRVLKATPLVIGMVRAGLRMVCIHPQDSGEVVLCNMMQLTFEAIEDEFAAMLPIAGILK